jgi:hypothetical protein
MRASGHLVLPMDTGPFIKSLPHKGGLFMLALTKGLRLQRLTGAFAAAAICGVTACGGGGGGSAAAPAPTPLAPPPASGTSLTLTELPASCAQGSGCITYGSAEVDAAGEATLIWSERVAGQSGRLAAANHAVGGAALLSNGTLAQGFDTSAVQAAFIARAVAARRFVVMQLDSPAPGAPAPAPGVQTPLTVHVVSMAASGAPSASAAVALPALRKDLRGFPTLVKGSDSKLYAFAPASPVAPASPIDLGSGQTLTVLNTPPMSFADVEAEAIADFTQSVEPRALWAVRAKSSSADARQMYLSQVRFGAGELLPFGQVSTQTFAVTTSQVGCVDEVRMNVQATSDSHAVVAWRQVNPANNGCDLMVGGQRVNAGTRSVGEYAISGNNGDIVAVWREVDNTPNSNRIFWSRLDPLTSLWSTPGLLAPQYASANDEQLLLVQAAGPGSTLAVAWQRFPAGSAGSPESWLLSKYVNGAWSTTASQSSDRPRTLAINANGQGAALMVGNNCGSATACERLSLLRF